MKLKDLQKGEFWVSSIIYLCLFIGLISKTTSEEHGDLWIRFYKNHVDYSSFTSYFVPELFNITILYISFLLLNFGIVPSLINKRKEALNYFLIIFFIGVVTLITGICRTYSLAYQLVEYKSLQHAYNHIFFKSFYYAILVVVIITAYVLIKNFIIYLISNDFNKVDNQLKIDVITSIIFWFIGMILLLATNASVDGAIAWTLVIFCTFLIVLYSIYILLPANFIKNKRFKSFYWKLVLSTLLLSIPLFLVALIIFRGREDDAFATLAFFLPTQLIISAPLAWYVYKRRFLRGNELYGLKTELGKSDASLHFLQSQINPHFLFNALNTLFGTALQEGAERTGEGIQKLGDMMRFMLHENVQDKISLTRDVDYLENYISLQKLRTSRSADIIIETQIDEQLNNLQIAPMLLIPFVENAFKHGISLQQPSHIKITLQTKANKLYFDVNNSIYIKPDHDPEKLKSGIGLENVKQRLALLYPDKHELIIRESAKEFFIHLTIEL